MSPVKTAEPIEIPFGIMSGVGPWKHVLNRGSRSPHVQGTFCRELCKNGLTDHDTVWDVNSCEPKEARAGRGCTLAPSGEYD